MSLRTTFEVLLYLHEMVSVSTEATRKKLNIVRNAVISRPASMAVPFVQKAWDGLTKLYLLELLRFVIQ